MNVVFAFCIASVIYFTGLPVTINPPIIGYVEPNSAEAKLGIEEGDQITAVDGTEVGSWEAVQNATVFARTNVIAVTIERHGVKQTYQLTTTISDVIGLKVLNLDPRDHPLVQDVLAGSPAEKAGIKSGDEIVSVAKVPVFGREHFIKMIQGRPLEPTEIVLKRKGEKWILRPKKD